MQVPTPEPRLEASGSLREATPSELTEIDGGRMKLPGVVNRVPLLSPDGEPITVIVDGFRVGPN
jgi:hypothetical protein